MELEEEKREGSEGDSSEWEEYTDSEEEDAGPRLKPVFVRKLVRHILLSAVIINNTATKLSTVTMVTCLCMHCVQYSIYNS